MSKAVKTALIGNFGIFVMKTAAAFITRSAGMTAEAVHSLADTGNQVLLMFGMKQSKKKADVHHPFGHGKEEYFWSFIVAMLLFVLGGVYSMYEGFHKIFHPEALKHVYLNLIILGASAGMEGYSWWVAKKELNCSNGELLEEIIDSKDSNTVVVFIEDTGALIGLALALVGNLLSYITGNPFWDACSSVVIGVLLFVMALFLANEMLKLIIGEAIDDVEMRYIRRVINSHSAVLKVGKIRTMQLGNNSAIVAVDVDFVHDLVDRQLEDIMVELKQKIRATVPCTEHIFIQLQRVE